MKFHLAVSLVLILVLAIPLTLLAQTIPEPVRGSWDTLKSVQPGDELVVELRNQRTVKGRLGSATDAVLILVRRGNTTEISRGDVLKLFWLIRKSRKKTTLIGLAIGAGIGAGIGRTQAPSDLSEGESYPIYVLGGVGAGLGALAGYLMGSGKERRLIYETR